jgi:hypothetical protein
MIRIVSQMHNDAKAMQKIDRAKFIHPYHTSVEDGRKQKPPSFPAGSQNDSPSNLVAKKDQPGTIGPLAAAALERAKVVKQP